MYLILSSGDQNNIPSRQLDLHGYLCFPRGSSTVLFSGPPQLSERVLFAEPVYLWVGKGEDMQCAVCGRVNREHTYTAVKTKATWRVSYANTYFAIWSCSFTFSQTASFSALFSPHQMSNLPGFQWNFSHWFSTEILYSQCFGGGWWDNKGEELGGCMWQGDVVSKAGTQLLCRLSSSWQPLGSPTKRAVLSQNLRDNKGLLIES